MISGTTRLKIKILQSIFPEVFEWKLNIGSAIFNQIHSLFCGRNIEVSFYLPQDALHILNIDQFNLLLLGKCFYSLL